MQVVSPTVGWASVCAGDGTVRRNDELCSTIQNEEFCIFETRNYVSKTRNFVFKVMDFAGAAGKDRGADESEHRDCRGRNLNE